MNEYEKAVLEAHHAVLLSRGRVRELIENRKKIALEAIDACEIFSQFTGDNEEQFDETLVPYFFLIKRIKDNPNKTIKEIVGIQEMENIAAALAAFEEYDLMERYVAEGNTFNIQTSVGAFRNWQPTPFYYVITKKVFDNLKDARKLLTFLVKNNADPNKLGNGDTLNPLLLSYDIDWFEAGQLLLLYGAEMEIVQQLLEKRENLHIVALKITATTTFPSGAGKDHTSSRTLSIADLEKGKQLTLDYFHITIQTISEKHLEGKVYWQDQDSNVPYNLPLTFDCGGFNLSSDNPEYNTNSLNISYGTYSELSLSIQLSDIQVQSP